MSASTCGCSRAWARGATGVRRPRELDDVEALVIPGGESTTMDKLVRAFDLQEPLRKRLADGMPAYGSCAGMIMLADRIADARPDQQTLGGLDITVRRNAFGRQVDSFEEDLHMPDRRGDRRPGDELFRAVFIRAPWVEETGAGVEVLGTVESGPADRQGGRDPAGQPAGDVVPPRGHGGPPRPRVLHAMVRAARG